MKKNMSAQEIIAKRIENDRIIKSLPIREYRKNNRQVDKNFRLFRILENDLELAKEVYKELLLYDCVITKLNAAAECLSLKIHIEEAEQILVELSHRSDIGVKSFEAQIGFELWKEQGYLKMYPEQEIAQREES